MSAANDNGDDYAALLHAMQSGVAYCEATEMIPRVVPREQAPKRLRVGINAAMSDHAGLAALLISKGVITAGEYAAAITEAMRREVDAYRRRIADEAGVDPDKVTLA